MHSLEIHDPKIHDPDNEPASVQVDLKNERSWLGGNRETEEDVLNPAPRDARPLSGGPAGCTSVIKSDRTNVHVSDLPTSPPRYISTNVPRRAGREAHRLSINHEQA